MRLRRAIAPSALVVAISVTAIACGHPSDDDLIANFEEHREEFGKLLEMVEVDSNAKRVAPDFLIPEKVISEDRWNEYRGLFRTTNIPEGIVIWSPSARVEFLASTIGMVTGGTVKGYAYLSAPPEPSTVYPSLDQRPQRLKSNVRAYREIRDRWYIFYEWDD